MRLPEAQCPDSQEHTTFARNGQLHPATPAAKSEEAPSYLPTEVAYYPVEAEHRASSSVDAIALSRVSPKRCQYERR
jgi:hypothetical protein